MSKFSETLDYLMKTHDMSNDELADLVGVNRTTISRWRSGSRSPKMEKLSELAAIFSVLLIGMIVVDEEKRKRK